MKWRGFRKSNDGAAAVEFAILLPLLISMFVGVVETSLALLCRADSDIAGFLPELIEHHHAGRLPFDRFVTRYPFAQINQAIADGHEGRCIKPVLVLG